VLDTADELEGVADEEETVDVCVALDDKTLLADEALLDDTTLLDDTEGLVDATVLDDTAVLGDTTVLDDATLLDETLVGGALGIPQVPKSVWQPSRQKSIPVPLH
jgi:hypothetical protein